MKKQMNERRQRTQTTRKQRVTSVSYLKILTFVQEISSLIKGRKFLRNTHYTPHEAFCKMKEENCMNKQPWQTWVSERQVDTRTSANPEKRAAQVKPGSRIRVFGAEPCSADPFRNNSDIKEPTLWGISRSPEPASTSTQHISDLLACWTLSYIKTRKKELQDCCKWHWEIQNDSKFVDATIRLGR